MKAIVIAAAVFALTAFVASAAPHTSATVHQAKTPPSVDTATLYTVGPAHAPGVVSEATAVKSVKEYAEVAARPHVSISGRYGAVDLQTQMTRMPGGSLQSLGTRDAWVITVRGFDIPRFATDPFATQAGIPQPHLHNATFIVDGKTGTVLQGTWG